MLIATRAGVFRGRIMRSVDDNSEYLVPVRRRSWSRNGFRKRNMMRFVPKNAPTRITPEKHPEEIDLNYFQKVAPFLETFQITLGPWTKV
jgi:hypothetical protein